MSNRNLSLFIKLFLGLGIGFWLVNSLILSLFLPYLIQQKNQWVSYQFALNKVKDLTHADILILGDSTAATSLEPKAFGVNTLAIGPWGTGPAEWSLLLNNYLEKNNPPKCLILSSIYPKEHYEKDRFWPFLIKYNVLSSKYIDQIYERSLYTGDFPATHHSPMAFRIRRLAYKLKWPPFYHYELRNAFTFSFNKDMDERLKNLTENSGAFIKETQGARLMDWHFDFIRTPFKPSAFFDSYITEIKNTLAENKIKAFFLPIPLSPKLSQYDLLGRWKKTQEHFASSFPLLTKKPLPQFENHEFRDAIHLNKQGIEKLTAFYKSDVLAKCFN